MQITKKKKNVIFINYLEINKESTVLNELFIYAPITYRLENF